MTTNKATSARSVVEKFEQALDRSDVDQAVGLMTDDCTFEASWGGGSGTTYVGREAIRECFQMLFDQPGGMQFVEEEPAIMSDDRVVTRWHIGSGEDILRGVDVYRVSGDKIAEKLTYTKRD